MPDLELVRSQWAVGRLFMMWAESDLNIWINKFCPRIHGYRYTQKHWSSMIRNVWKSETFFTISSPGRRGVGGLSLWLGSGNNPLWEVYLIQFTINGWCKNRFWWLFHQFYCSTCSVLSGPHAVAHFPLITIPRLASPRANNLPRDENNYLRHF